MEIEVAKLVKHFCAIMSRNWNWKNMRGPRPR